MIKCSIWTLLVFYVQQYNIRQGSLGPGVSVVVTDVASQCSVSLS